MHFIRHIKAFHIVLCLAALFSLNNLFFLALDKSSLCADAGDNFCTSIHYFRLWNRIPNQELFSEFNNINRNRPLGHTFGWSLVQVPRYDFGDFG